MMKKYEFEDIRTCEMCGDETTRHRLLGQRLNCSQGHSPKAKEGISVSVKQCSKCSLIYASPLPVPFDIADHYGTPPEQYWTSPDALGWNSDYFARQIALAKQLLDFKPGMRALDIGAGLGKALRSLTNAGFDAFGIEPSQPFYERAISMMHVDPDRLKLGQIEDISYEENFFDFITFGAVFEHLYHPAEALAKARQWLRPGGIIHIEVPSAAYFMSKLFNIYYRLCGTTYVTNLSPMHSPFHLYEFHLKSFNALSTRFGLEVKEHYIDVGKIRNVPQILHPPLRQLMSATQTGMQLTVYLRATQARHL